MKGGTSGLKDNTICSEEGGSTSLLGLNIKPSGTGPKVLKKTYVFSEGFKSASRGFNRNLPRKHSEGDLANSKGVLGKSWPSTTVQNFLKKFGQGQSSKIIFRFLNPVDFEGRKTQTENFGVSTSIEKKSVLKVEDDFSDVNFEGNSVCSEEETDFSVDEVPSNEGGKADDPLQDEGFSLGDLMFNLAASSSHEMITTGEENLENLSYLKESELQAGALISQVAVDG
ncbi:hypothetical protein M0R45_006038 [Rubus argutus]|uniref:Uncharacterized protein n=1 Tax=Rubus argutus TaxID=59490 RepID=A0AAW1YPC0_RUBAR